MIEGFINAAFFVTQPVEVSQRALKHKDYAVWKHMNRVIGTGEFAFTLSTDPDPKASAALMSSGFLAAFAQIHNCLPLIDVERKLFKRLYKAAQSEDFGRDSSSSAEEQD